MRSGQTIRSRIRRLESNTGILLADRTLAMIDTLEREGRVMPARAWELRGQVHRHRLSFAGSSQFTRRLQASIAEIRRIPKGTFQQGRQR